MDLVQADTLRVIRIQVECAIPEEATFVDKVVASWELFFKFIRMQGYIMRQLIPRVDVKGMAVRNYRRASLFNKSVYLFALAFINQEINNTKRNVLTVAAGFHYMLSKIFNFPRDLLFIALRMLPKKAIKVETPKGRAPQMLPKTRPQTFKKNVTHLDSGDLQMASAESDDVFELLSDDNDSLLGSVSEQGSAFSANRMVHLEMEIDNLKKQLAAVLTAVGASNPQIQQQMARSISNDALLISFNDDETSVSLSDARSSAVASVIKCAPPPPPPPPANLFSRSRIDLNYKKEDVSPPPTAVKGGEGDRTVSMTDVLKEMNSVKLRSVSKMGSSESLNQSQKDISGFFKGALENKFKNAHINDSFDNNTSAEWGDEN